MLLKGQSPLCEAAAAQNLSETSVRTDADAQNVQQRDFSRDV